MSIVPNLPSSLNPSDQPALAVCEEEALASSRAEFDQLVAYVTGNAQAAQLHEAEEGIFRRLISLGLTLLGLYLARKGPGPADSQLASQGRTWQRNGTKRRVYRSVFGAIEVFRAYFYRSGEGGFFPLDRELNLRKDGYSRLLCKWSNCWSVQQAFAKVAEFFKEVLGLLIWTRPLEQLSRTAAEDAEAFVRETAPPAVSEEAELLIISADCKGVPMRLPADEKTWGRKGKGAPANKKKMAVVTAIYNVKRFVRTADDVMKDAWRWLYGESEDADTPKAPKPEGKRVWATLKGKDHAFELVKHEVRMRDPEGEADIVIFTDGEKALHQRLAALYPQAKAVVLDFIHVAERLWAVGNVLHGEGTDACKRWVALRGRGLLIGNVGYVIGAMKQILTKREKRLSAYDKKVIGGAITYFENNRNRMQYHKYLAAGYPIATGVVEGTCRHLVNDRLELTGMRWTEEGAEAVLNLRAIKVSEQWEDFWPFRFERDRERLYAQHADARPLRPLRSPRRKAAG